MKWSDQVAPVALVDDIDVEAAERRRLVRAKLSSGGVRASGDSPDSGDSKSDEKTPSIVDFHQMAKRLSRNISDKNQTSGTAAKKSKSLPGKRGRALEAYRTGSVAEPAEVRGLKLDKVG